MYLSNLQRKIILESYFRSGKILFEEIVKFYKGRAGKNIKGIITKSLERLMKKELISVVAKKTPHKLFIKEIKLTTFGRQLAKRILNQGQKLPLKIKN
ncbi:MAG: hypothetical protein N2259_00450 [Patescibacteria group bacterium]|nr:hypothetical protein [Patescibacteria group bacterium]